MTFIESYNHALQHSSSNKITLHLAGRVLIGIAIGVLLAQPLKLLAVPMIILGILFILPILAETMKHKTLSARKTVGKRKKSWAKDKRLP